MVQVQGGRCSDLRKGRWYDTAIGARCAPPGVPSAPALESACSPSRPCRADAGRQACEPMMPRHVMSWKPFSSAPHTLLRVPHTLASRGSPAVPSHSPAASTHLGINLHPSPHPLLPGRCLRATLPCPTGATRTIRQLHLSPAPSLHCLHLSQASPPRAALSLPPRRRHATPRQAAARPPQPPSRPHRVSTHSHTTHIMHSKRPMPQSIAPPPHVQARSRRPTSDRQLRPTTARHSPAPTCT